MQVMTNVSNDGIGRTCGVDSGVAGLAKKWISSKKVTSAETYTDILFEL
jgi:hypothetical protein